MIMRLHRINRYLRRFVFDVSVTPGTAKSSPVSTPGEFQVFLRLW